LNKKTSIEILILLADGGAYPSSLKLSLDWLARRLGTSRQTAARRLIELEGRGLIKRELGPRGQSVRLTSAGMAVLRSVHREIGAILSGRTRALRLVGQVTSGVGEGSYYMGQAGYRKQLRRTLGFDPYPGTLDVMLDRQSLELKAQLERLSGRRVEGFETPERTFGPVKCFPAKLRGTKVAVILPSRSHYTDVIELVSPKNLRRSLRLADGDEVKIEVMA
jgi:riboflavin kinase